MKREIKKIEEQNQKKSGTKKWLFIGLGVAATGALSYFGWQYWKKNKSQTEEDASSDAPDFPSDNASTYIPKPKSAPTRNDAFPLKKGSKGANVKALQEVLIAKLGKDILGKSGADGDFGSKTEAALKKAGLSISIDETTFNVLVKGSSPDPSSTASQLYTAATKKDYAKAIGLLKTLRNANDYKAVSDVFVNYRINGVRQTLVNGLLNSFNDEKQKQGIRLAFSSMGLKYDGSKWSLAGFDQSKLLLTNRNTKVWKNPKTSVPVPANMVLGKEITRRGGYTLFENDKQLFLVQSQHVKHYK
jgi:peptidoglycan hydrolase-like protein with peptidoglycan-binding domain